MEPKLVFRGLAEAVVHARPAEGTALGIRGANEHVGVGQVLRVDLRDWWPIVGHNIVAFFGGHRWECRPW